MQTRSLIIGIGIAIAATVVTAARAPRAASQNPAQTAATDLRLPGAVVVAKYPSVNDILDIILGDVPSANTSEARIGAMLAERTGAERANRIAHALVSEGRKQGLEAPLLVGVLLTENPDLAPNATSKVGARGLMQVMPFHAGHWGCPSSDLFNIESNICHGVRILADNLRHSRDLPTALLKYNGCVRGTITPDCHAYAARVSAFARKNSIIQ